MAFRFRGKGVTVYVIDDADTPCSVTALKGDAEGEYTTMFLSSGDRVMIPKSVDRVATTLGWSEDEDDDD